MRYFTGKADTVRYVRELLNDLAVGSRLITVTDREKSGEFYVTAVINSLSDDTPTPKS